MKRCGQTLTMDCRKLMNYVCLREFLSSNWEACNRACFKMPVERIMYYSRMLAWWGLIYSCYTISPCNCAVSHSEQSTMKHLFLYYGVKVVFSLYHIILMAIRSWCFLVVSFRGLPNCSYLLLYNVSEFWAFVWVFCKTLWILWVSASDCLTVHLILQLEI